MDNIYTFIPFYSSGCQADTTISFSQHMLNAWYSCSYAIGSEILIGLSVTLLECKYYEHFGPDNIFFCNYSAAMFFLSKI